jgi:hypothetical protein
MYSRDFPRLHDVGVTKNSIGRGNGGESAQQPGIEIMSRQAHGLGRLPQQAHERIEKLGLALHCLAEPPGSSDRLALICRIPASPDSGDECLAGRFMIGKLA